MPDLTAPPSLTGRWLPDLVARLGSAETTPDDRERWTWQDGDVGVFIDKHTSAWQAVAWTPLRSMTLRTTTRPTDAEIGRMVLLAGLHDVRASTR